MLQKQLHQMLLTIFIKILNLMDYHKMFFYHYKVMDKNF